MATRTHARPVRLLLVLTAVSATALGVLPLAAGAEPAPSLTEVAAQLDALQMKADQAVEAYNTAKIALDAATRKPPPLPASSRVSRITSVPCSPRWGRRSRRPIAWAAAAS